MAITIAPDFTDGVVSAARLQQLSDAINQRSLVTARVTTAQTLTASITTLQDVTELAVPVEAQAIYEFDFAPQYSTNGTADLKIGFTFPVNLTMAYVRLGFNAAATWVADTGIQTSVLDYGGNATSAFLKGVVVVGSNSGTLTVQSAQNTANASVTQIVAGSVLTLRRFA